jgi:hypothetical protein
LDDLNTSFVYDINRTGEMSIYESKKGRKPMKHKDSRSIGDKHRREGRSTLRPPTLPL